MTPPGEEMKLVADLCKALRETGRFASESEREAAERRIRERRQAADLIEQLVGDRDRAVELLRRFDDHLGEDDRMWSDQSSVTPEWIGSDGIRRTLSFGLFRQVRAFLDSLGER